MLLGKLLYWWCGRGMVEVVAGVRVYMKCQSPYSFDTATLPSPKRVTTITTLHTTSHNIYSPRQTRDGIDKGRQRMWYDEWNERRGMIMVGWKSSADREEMKGAEICQYWMEGGRVKAGECYGVYFMLSFEILRVWWEYGWEKTGSVAPLHHPHLAGCSTNILYLKDLWRKLYTFSGCVCRTVDRSQKSSKHDKSIEMKRCYM